jgi:hypothetical protein
VQNNPDWRERWDLVLVEIPINRWFLGFKGTHPTLQKMFVAVQSHYKQGGLVPGNGKDIGVERVLAGEFEWLRITPVATTAEEHKQRQQTLAENVSSTDKVAALKQTGHDVIQ